VTIFANVSFGAAGSYVVQALINSNVFAEQELTVTEINQPQTVVTAETVH
jgi:hypothetical protein